MPRFVQKTLLRVGFSLALIFVHESFAEARPCRVNLIPNGNRLSCGACHVSQFGGGPRNAFGTAVGTLVGLGTCEQFWGPRLAALDSDGDGISNGAELEDPDGTWSLGMPNHYSFGIRHSAFPD